VKRTKDGIEIQLRGLRIVVSYEFHDIDEGVSIRVSDHHDNCLLRFDCFDCRPVWIVSPHREFLITDSVRSAVDWAIEQIEHSLVLYLSLAGYPTPHGLSETYTRPAIEKIKAAVAEVSAETELEATG
jgi:hypothetical protein